jgi:hypothetical protein
MKNMGMDVSHGLMIAMRSYVHVIIIIGKRGGKEEHTTSASDCLGIDVSHGLMTDMRKRTSEVSQLQSLTS